MAVHAFLRCVRYMALVSTHVGDRHVIAAHDARVRLRQPHERLEHSHRRAGDVAPVVRALGGGERRRWGVAGSGGEWRRVVGK